MSIDSSFSVALQAAGVLLADDGDDGVAEEGAAVADRGRRQRGQQQRRHGHGSRPPAHVTVVHGVGRLPRHARRRRLDAQGCALPVVVVLLVGMHVVPQQVRGLLHEGRRHRTR